MTDTTTLETEDWAAVKLLPRRTGLPFTIWITEKEGYPHDVRVKVSPIGSWHTSPSIGVRPTPREIVQGSLPADDVAKVSQWIILNRDTIIDFWNGVIDFAEVADRLQRLP